MRAPKRAAAAALAAFVVLGLPACTDPFAEEAVAAQVSRLDVVPVRVTTSDGRTHIYKAEVARTSAEQTRGLMHRRKMPRDAGMLFPMNPVRVASFWMRNTYLPLDIIFISPEGRVLNVGEGRPLDETPVEAVGLTGAVLELNRGEAARIGLKAGDRVSWGGK
jgi:uncharacterized protein